MITIYQANTTAIRQVVDPDSTSQQEQAIMGKDTVTLSFKLPFAVNFAIGDHARIFGYLYKINATPSLQKTASRQYQYTVTLEGQVQDLGKVQFLGLDASNNYTVADHDFRGRLIDHANLLLNNIKRVYPDDPANTADNWVIAGVQDTDYINITYSATNCLDALNTMVKAFDTEWLVDGTRIWLYKRQPASNVLLKYGAGLYSLTRQPLDNSNVVTRLYAYGSDRNIGSNYRNGAKRLRMASSLYLEKNVDKYGVFEGTKIFDDIYPNRMGTVSAVTSPFIFADSTLDFDINDELIQGVSAKVTFNTGLLAGYTFEIHEYDAPTKTFTILKNTSDQTADIPSVTLTPAVGDKYVLTDITLPLSYINAAEAALLTAAQAELVASSEPKYVYTIVCDPIYFFRNRIQLKLSQSIALQDTNLAIDLYTRITGITRNIRIPWAYTLNLSDYVVTPLTTKIINLLKSA